MKNIKNLLKLILPGKLFNWYRVYKIWLFDGYSMKSYSQEGEDMILRRIFEGQKDGFYVDVGAHHPKRFSNTYYFYKLGWCGINIDAMPGSMVAFNKSRPRDINLEVPISSNKQILSFFVFNEPALNSFSADLSKEREYLENDYRIVSKIKLETDTLENVLDAYMSPTVTIDFMSIDVEGFDFDVMQSNNWNK